MYAIVWTVRPSRCREADGAERPIARTDEREATIAAIRDRAGAEQRKQAVRAKLLAILGGLPDYAGPLLAATL